MLWGGPRSNQSARNIGTEIRPYFQRGKNRHRKLAAYSSRIEQKGSKCSRRPVFCSGMISLVVRAPVLGATRSGSTTPGDVLPAGRAKIGAQNRAPTTTESSRTLLAGSGDAVRLEAVGAETGARIAGNRKTVSGLLETEISALQSSGGGAALVSEELRAEILTSGAR